MRHRTDDGAPRRTRLTARLFLIAVTVAVVSFAGAAVDADAASATRLLTSRSSPAKLAEVMTPAGSWRPFPPAADRASWTALDSCAVNRHRRVWIVRAAEDASAKPWPVLSPSLYREYARTGDRSGYEAPYFARRERLATLVLAECFEHRGRFLRDIASGLTEICAEPTWCVPAHAPPTMPARREHVDLFAAETAMTLATARYLLGADLDSIAPGLRDRVLGEVDRRVLTPVESGDFGNSGWLDGRSNWSTWCASNVLGASLLLVDDVARRSGLAWNMMEVADRFVDGYGDDGGCEEGPGYWNEAGGALLVLLELLRSRTDGAVDVYEQPKIRAIGAFAANAHIAGPWYVNFSDADARSLPHPARLYRFGERTANRELMNLALCSEDSSSSAASGDTLLPGAPPLRMSGTSAALLGPLTELFWMPAGATPDPPVGPLRTWLPDLQLLALRSSTDPDSGLYVAMRGGHNGESHNHNDVGHFVVYLDGEPAIVDVGRESYDNRTFSDQRYRLWYVRGNAHNAPVVNGVEQGDGRDRASSSVVLTETADSVRFGMDLERAYPDQALLGSLRRELVFRTGAAQAEVRDRWEMKGHGGSVCYNLFTPSEVKRVEPGLLTIAGRRRPLYLRYEPKTAKVVISRLPLSDRILRRNWGDRLLRIRLEIAGEATGEASLDFGPQK